MDKADKLFICITTQTVVKSKPGIFSVQTIKMSFLCHLKQMMANNIMLMLQLLDNH